MCETADNIQHTLSSASCSFVRGNLDGWDHVAAQFQDLIDWPLENWREFMVSQESGDAAQAS